LGVEVARGVGVSVGDGDAGGKVAVITTGVAVTTIGVGVAA